MKNLLIMLAVVSACTEAPNNQNSLPNISNDLIMEMAPSTIDLSMVGETLSGTISGAASSIDFGDVYVGAKATKRITLLAKTNIPSLDLSDFEESQVFVLKKSTCKQSLPAKRNCILDIEYSPTQSGAVSELLSINSSLSFEFEANAIAAPIVQPPTPVEQAETITVSSNINLGNFTGIVKSGRLSVTNTGKKVVDLDMSYTMPSGFSYVSYCSAQLGSKRSCQIEVSYMSSVKETSDVSKTASVTVNDKEVEFAVVHKGSAIQESQSFAWTTNPLNLGTLSSPRKQILYISNTTSSAIAGLSFNSLPSGVSVSRTNCSANISSKRQCFVELNFNPSQMYDGAFSFNYSYSNGNVAANLPISATVVGGLPTSVPCSLADVQANGWNTENYSTISGNKTGTDVTSCIISSCQPGFNVNNLSCSIPLCTDSNASDYGFNLAYTVPGSISGNVPNCSITCGSSPLVSLASDGKSCDSKFIFLGVHSEAGLELHRTNGFVSELMMDIFPGSSGGIPNHGMEPYSYLINYGKFDVPMISMPMPNGKKGFVFMAREGIDTSAVYFSDGTSAGTVKIAETGFYSVNLSSSVLAGSKLFYHNNTPESGWETWVFDSMQEVSATNPKMLVDFNPGPGNGRFLEMTLVNDKIYFSSNKGDSVGVGVYVYSLTQPLSSTNPALLFDSVGTAPGHVIKYIEKIDHFIYYWENAFPISTKMVEINTNTNSVKSFTLGGYQVSSFFTLGKRLIFQAASSNWGNFHDYTPYQAVSGTNPKTYTGFTLSTKPVLLNNKYYYFNTVGGKMRLMEFDHNAAEVAGVNPRILTPDEAQWSYGNETTFEYGESFFEYNGMIMGSIRHSDGNGSYYPTFFRYNPSQSLSSTNPFVFGDLGLIPGTNIENIKVANNKIYFVASNEQKEATVQNWNYDPECPPEDEQWGWCTREQYYYTQKSVKSLFQCNPSVNASGPFSCEINKLQEIDNYELYDSDGKTTDYFIQD